MFTWFGFYIYIYIYIFLISTKSKEQKGHPLLSLGHQEALFWSCPPMRESLKKPYFPLPLSILVGTNLIILLLFLFNPRLLPKKIHPPFDFWENSSSFDFRENPCKTPKENKKIAFLLLLVFFGYVLGVSLLLCHWI